MAKYKEIKINLSVKPEVLLGEILKHAIQVPASTTVQSEPKKPE